MQELKVWRSFLHLPHRQGSYNMPMLSKRFPYPLKKLSLSGILCGVTQKHCSLGFGGFVNLYRSLNFSRFVAGRSGPGT